MDIAATFAAITRVLLTCESMFEYPIPTDVFITTFGLNDDGRLTRYYHEEQTGAIKTALVSIQNQNLKAVTLQFGMRGRLIKDQVEFTVWGQVELSDGKRCPVAGSRKTIKIIHQNLCLSPYRYISSSRRLYQISCNPVIASTETGPTGAATPGNPNVHNDIKTVTCDDHIALTPDERNFVLQKDGKCEMVKFGDFKDGWPLNQCEVEKVKVPPDMKRYGPFSMRHLVTVHGCSLQDPENATNVLDDNLVDNTVVEFLTNSSKLPVNTTDELTTNREFVIGGCIGAGVVAFAFICFIIGGIIWYCKKQRTKKSGKAPSTSNESSIRTAIPLAPIYINALPTPKQPQVPAKEPEEKAIKGTNEVPSEDEAETQLDKKYTQAPNLPVEPLPTDPKELLEDKELKIKIPRVVRKVKVFSMSSETPIARGLFSAIYAFRAPGAERETAIKFVAVKDNLNAEQAALIEITVLRNIMSVLGPTDPHLLTIIDAGRMEGLLYMVTPLMGPSLAVILKEVKLDLKTKLCICYQTCCAVRSMNTLGYCHGDIKPGNFLTQRNRDEPVLTVVDYGTTRIFGYSRNSDSLMGVPKYASIGAHYRRRAGQCDDFQSWLMMVAEMFAPLPWAEEKDLDKMRSMKNKWDDFTVFLPAEYSRLAFSFNKMKEAVWHARYQDVIDSTKFGPLIQGAASNCDVVDITGPWLPPKK